ncbi:unnamed protein product [Kuraishia capsulata CBS 1993]|uniref:Uncharacterized protein n=1 Tax=Kuraishia capsulata CBS 1993 TaxID=1382522 RepID=W6MID1_9ASCO|nr:uncharacterized protein KUCA_T00001613001 [Kuraishia capsulata CBS 1993]CDK25643.1 unnamed protein product [Kuraishia capsulata CBS 1993]
MFKLIPKFKMTRSQFELAKVGKETTICSLRRITNTHSSHSIC